MCQNTQRPRTPKFSFKQIYQKLFTSTQNYTRRKDCCFLQFLVSSLCPVYVCIYYIQLLVFCRHSVLIFVCIRMYNRYTGCHLCGIYMEPNALVSIFFSIVVLIVVVDVVIVVVVSIILRILAFLLKQTCWMSVTEIVCNWHVNKKFLLYRIREKKSRSKERDFWYEW